MCISILQTCSIVSSQPPMSENFTVDTVDKNLLSSSSWVLLAFSCLFLLFFDFLGVSVVSDFSSIFVIFLLFDCGSEGF